MYIVFRNGVSLFQKSRFRVYFPGPGHFSDVLIDVQIDRAHYKSSAAGRQPAAARDGNYFSAIKTWAAAAFSQRGHTRAAVWQQSANNIQARDAQ